VNLRLRGRLAAFEAAQFSTVVQEHVAFRRRSGELGVTLRAYGEHHRRRASRTRWEMSDLHTVIVTAHNHAAFLADSLAAVLRQEWRPLELIVVDDASTDDTREVLPGLLANLPSRVTARTFHNPRSLGQTGSINLATLAARGSVLTMADADDYMLGGTIPLARDLLAKHQAFLFGGNPRMFWGELPVERDIDVPAEGVPVVRYEPDDICQRPTDLNISHNGSTYLRSAWRLVGGYRRVARTRITFASDRDFQLRLASVLPVVATPIDVSNWRIGTSTLRGSYR
jgi:glycosyltransferase involved in cell wall biosynthesis